MGGYNIHGAHRLPGDPSKGGCWLPKTYAGRDRISADKWDSGENGEVSLMSLDPHDGENVDDDVKIVKKLTYKELEAENEKLKARVAELEEKLGIKPEGEEVEEVEED